MTVEIQDKNLAILDSTAVVPNEATSKELLYLIAEQNAANIRLNLANLVGIRERSRATALTIGAAIADGAWFATSLEYNFGSIVSNVLRGIPIIAPIIGIGGIVLTTMAVRRWMNVENVMGRVLDYQPRKQNAEQPKS